MTNLFSIVVTRINPSFRFEFVAESNLESIQKHAGRWRVLPRFCTRLKCVVNNSMNLKRMRHCIAGSQRYDVISIRSFLGYSTTGTDTCFAMIRT